MKKTLFILILTNTLVLIPITLAATNMQQVISVRDDVHEAVTHLYIQQGLALPSSSGPWSADELMKMLERINTDELIPAQQRTYNYAYSRLTAHESRKQDSSVLVDFGLELAAETYLKTNTEDGFATQEDIWLYDYTQRSPVLTLPLNVWATDHFYGYFELALMNSRHYEYFDQSVATNLVVDHFLEGTNTVAGHFPSTGFVSAGGNRWNIQFGRDKLRWGDGISGNLILGDHLDYHEFIKFATYHDKFKFSTVISSFTHPAAHYKNENEYLDGSPKLGDLEDQVGGFRAFIGHRLEFRPWDVLKISISETMMYMGDNFDFRFLNPGMFYHNYYMRSNSKSLLAVDINYAVSSKYNVYVNTVLDNPGLFNFARAAGVLGGVKASFPMHNGVFYAQLEGAYTDPLLYLRDGGESEFPIDYIVSIWQWGENFPTDDGPESGLYEVRRFLGYQHGNDVVALQVEAGYKEYGLWSLQGKALLLFNGTLNMFSEYDAYNDTEELGKNLSPTSSLEGKDSVQTSLMIELLGTYHPTSRIGLFGHLGFVHLWNIDNLKGNGNGFDVQVSTGISYSL